MKLKKFTLLGFKSFADKVSIDFNHPVVAIVGPNGCGKSNIVEAFKWVLGEQSAKSLRGDKMLDVLFAGSESRKPLNFAEASIVLTDIESSQLPYTEISVGRRLYRNGESEYLLNNQVVRLKDVQDLFLGTGVGKNAFSLFEQGQLDRVIYLHPLQRRLIFDDVAGIGRFLQRKGEALQKLTQVAENYNRLCDIHAEVEKQLKILRKQAAQAKEYRENKEKLATLEKAVLLMQWQEVSVKEEKNQKEATEIERAKRVHEEQLTALRDELKKARTHLQAAAIKKEESKKKFYETQTGLEVQKSLLQERQTYLETLIKREKATRGDLENFGKQRDEDVQELEKGIEEKKRSLALLSAEIDTLKVEFDASENALKKKQRAEEEMKLSLGTAPSFLQETNDRKNPIFRRLRPFPRAINTFLLERHKDISAACAFLKQRGHSNFVLLPLDQIKKGSNGDVVCITSEAFLTSFSEEEAKKELSSIETKIEKLKREIIAAEKKRQELSEKRRKKEMHLVRENFALQNYLSDLKKNKEVHLYEKKLRSELQAMHIEKATLLQEIESKQKWVSAEEKKTKKMSSVFQENIGEIEEIQNSHDALERMLEAENGAFQQLEKKQHALQLLRREDILKLQNLEEALMQKYSLKKEQLGLIHANLDGNYNEHEKKVRELRLLVERAGDVNLAAIDACLEQEERFHFLDGQLSDLSESKKDIEAIIALLEKESRKIFKETFETIRKNFQHNFSLLFSGGEADLKFTESSDILQAGVEIIARPPGKQMRAISLLSGGEKCLTALALLFSIFAVRPAPFCILDEVDAPLDESNVGRFIEMLRTFATKTQFVIVTHNKKTMAFADLLIGISMEEKGVSKLISLEFEKKRAMHEN